MKKFITFVLILLSVGAFSQNQMTDTWLSFPNSETLNSRRNIRVQHTLFVDPFSTAPNNKGGKQFGYELTAIMGGIYVSPSVSTFPQLKDGYADLVLSTGINWYMFNTSAVRYFVGGRVGYEFRGSSTPFILFGLSAGIDVTIIIFRNGNSLYLGGELWVDSRSSQEDRFYGDSSVDKGVIFTGNQAVENGKIRLGFSF